MARVSHGSHGWQDEIVQCQARCEELEPILQRFAAELPDTWHLQIIPSIDKCFRNQYGRIDARWQSTGPITNEDIICAAKVITSITHNPPHHVTAKEKLYIYWHSIHIVVDNPEWKTDNTPLKELLNDMKFEEKETVNG